MLSAIYPLRVDTEDPRRVRELLTAIPGDGIDYGLLRYLRRDTANRLADFDGPQLLLNYLGHAERRWYQRAVAGPQDCSTGCRRCQNRIWRCATS